MITLTYVEAYCYTVLLMIVFVTQGVMYQDGRKGEFTPFKTWIAIWICLMFWPIVLIFTAYINLFGKKESVK